MLSHLISRSKMRFLTAAFLGISVFLASAAAFAQENLEARWDVDEGKVAIQLEYKNGVYTARSLDDIPECGLSVCDEIMHGTLGKDGIFTGESRVCQGRECLQSSWKFSLGILSRDNNELKITGAVPHITVCGDLNSARKMRLKRRSSEFVDCDKRRAFLKIRRRIVPGISHDEVSALLEAVRELADRYPDEQGEAYLLRGRIFASSNEEKSFEKAKDNFEKAINGYRVVWGYCEMAILEADQPKKSEKIPPGSYLLKCDAARPLNCKQLNSPRMDNLRGLKEHSDLLKKRNCAVW